MNSNGQSVIIMSPSVEAAMIKLRAYMFEHVYNNSIAKSEESKVENMLIKLYEYYYEHIFELPEEYIDLINRKGQEKGRVVCDYVSGMSDQYSVMQFKELFVPNFWVN